MGSDTADGKRLVFRPGLKFGRMLLAGLLVGAPCWAGTVNAKDEKSRDKAIDREILEDINFFLNFEIFQEDDTEFFEELGEGTSENAD